MTARGQTFSRSSDLTTMFVYSLLESSAFIFKFVSLYHHGAVEVVKEHNVFSDNAGEENETEGVTKDFDRFNYMLKETNPLPNLLIYSSIDQVLTSDETNVSK